MKVETQEKQTARSKVDFCDFCGSDDVRPELVTMSLRRRGQDYRFENVSAEVCQQCGERYYLAGVIKELHYLIDAGKVQLPRSAA